MDIEEPQQILGGAVVRHTMHAGEKQRVHG